MKRSLSKRVLGTAIIMFFLATLLSCGVKDDTIRKNIEALPALSGVTAAVKDGAVTLTGEVKDDAAKAAAEAAVKTVKGVKSVQNDITIAPPPVAPAPVEISADEALSKSVADAINGFPGVKAEVKDGVITLTGEIRKASLQKLMQALNALKPRKIENKLTIK